MQREGTPEDKMQGITFCTATDGRLLSFNNLAGPPHAATLISRVSKVGPSGCIVTTHRGTLYQEVSRLSTLLSDAWHNLPSGIRATLLSRRV